jgi:hypothetical protein
MASDKRITSESLEKALVKQARNLGIAYQMETKCTRQEAYARVVLLLENLARLISEE